MCMCEREYVCLCVCPEASHGDLRARGTRPGMTMAAIMQRQRCRLRGGRKRARSGLKQKR